MTALALTPAAVFARYPRLTKAKAFAIASEWGSYLHSSDPGACFYSFRAGDGRPVSEEHRAQCLAYLERRRRAHRAQGLSPRAASGPPMTGRPYVPHASRPGYSALSLIRGAVLALLCAASLLLFAVACGLPALR